MQTLTQYVWGKARESAFLTNVLGVAAAAGPQHTLSIKVLVNCWLIRELKITS